MLRMVLQRPQLVNYRRRGLGTLLLKHVIAYAKQKGVRRITGSIVPDDVNTTPYLMGWYQKQGFQITKPTVDELEEALARIVMGLTPTET